MSGEGKLNDCAKLKNEYQPIEKIKGTHKIYYLITINNKIHIKSYCRSWIRTQTFTSISDFHYGIHFIYCQNQHERQYRGYDRQIEKWHTLGGEMPKMLMETRSIAMTLNDILRNFFRYTTGTKKLKITSWDRFSSGTRWCKYQLGNWHKGLAGKYW